MQKFWVLVDERGVKPIYITWDGWTLDKNAAEKFHTQAEAITQQTKRTHLKHFKPKQLEFENLEHDYQPRERTL